MLKEDFVGQAFLLENSKEYIVVSTYEIDSNIYAFIVSKQNVNDAMLAKIILNSEDIYIEEVHDVLITQKIMEIIKNNI